MMTRRLFAFSLFVLLFVAASVAQTSPGEFTLVALPDTQIYAKSYPQIFAAQTNWIAAHKNDMNIQLVIGLGDIVDAGGRISQWQVADSAYRVLDGVVPYIVPMGNHDYDANNPAGRTSSSKNFNTYFGPHRYAGQASYRGSYPAGSNENFYSVFTLGGKATVLLVLEPFPRNSSLSWAAAVLKKHADKDAIVVTHAYTYADSTRMDRCDGNSAASFNVAADNDGQQVWEKLVSRFANIRMVLSGHVVQGDGTGRRSDLGLNGNLVNQMLSDFQSWPNGGNGYLRLITVKPALNQILVRTYSPWTGQWLTDSHNQFTLPYRNMGGVARQGVLAGKVRNAQDCSAMSGVEVSDGVTAASTGTGGLYSMQASGPQGFALRLQKPGYSYVPQWVSVVPGYQNAGKVFMSSQGQLRGKVTRNGVPVAGATVVFEGGALRISRSVQTAADGTFSAGWIAVGGYKLTASAAGIAKATYSAGVTTGNTTFVSVVMQ